MEESFPVCTVQLWLSGLSFQLVVLRINQCEMIVFLQRRMAQFGYKLYRVFKILNNGLL